VVVEWVQGFAGVVSEVAVLEEVASILVLEGAASSRALLLQLFYFCWYRMTDSKYKACNSCCALIHMSYVLFATVAYIFADKNLNDAR
jgi:hypothetical protein